MCFSERELLAEEWRPVVGFPRYEVSNLGRLRSRIRTTDWAILATFATSKGYRRIALCREDGSKQKFRVHRLVLEAFVGPCPPGMECRHFPDNDTANNRLTNLGWATPVLNMLDRRVHDMRKRIARLA